MINTELDLATNCFGSLNSDVRERLQSLYDNPCQETWDDAYCIIIDKHSLMTLWQAVLIINVNFCRSKPLDEPWTQIPSKEEIQQALIYATH